MRSRPPALLGSRMAYALPMAAVFLWLLFMAVASLTQLGMERRRDRQALDRVFGLIEEVYVERLSRGLRGMDEEQVRLDLAGMLCLDGIEGAEIEDTAGHVLGAGSFPAAPERSQIYVLSHGDTDGVTQPLGTLRVDARARRTLGWNLHRIAPILLSGLLGLALLLPLLLRYTTQTLLIPVTTIKEQLRAIDLESLRSRGPNLNQRSPLRAPLEIWELERGVESMCARLTQALRESADNTESLFAAQDELRLERDRAQHYLDVAGVMLLALDHEQRVTMINPKGCEILGASMEDIVGKNWFDHFVPIQHRAEVKQVYDQIMAGQLAPVEYHENPVLRADGVQRSVAWRNSLLTDPGGAIVGVLSSGEDITERIQAEKALHESEERLRIAGQTAYDLIYEWEVESDSLKWFSDIDGFLGYEPGAISRDIGAWLALIHPDDREKMAAAVEVHRTSTEPIRFEYRVMRNDGEYRCWNDHGLPLCDAEGRPERWIGVCTDVTASKRAEEARTRLQAHLTQAQRMESIGRLAGGVAHDFNNMLNVILGHAELALEGLTPGHDLEGDLAEIQKAAQRSAALTRQLLAFARRQTVAPEVLDLNRTVDSMLRMLRRLVGEGIDLLWQPAEELPLIRMDPSQVDQLLANLVVNAGDAIGGLGKISIETYRNELDKEYCTFHPGFVPGEFVVLAISDDGPGMDEETKEQIFEPFFTTKSAEEGTGLGLATVYGIVKQNEGFINCYSELGQGTTFRIYLPIHRSEQPDLIREEPQAAPPARGDETILLVEDEPSILHLGARMLENMGYRVLAAGAPREAIGLAEKHAGEIHLLITDVIMPEMNGRDLAERLLPLYPNISRLFMSGYPANVIAHQGVLDEGVNFLQKPFTMEQLSRAARSALGDG